MNIDTERLTLIPCTAEILQAAIDSTETLSGILGVTIPDNWTEFGIEPLQYSLQSILKKPENEGWFTYFPIVKESLTLAGTCGFKGAPHRGTVEIGYEVAPIFRGHGFATEIAGGLVTHAFTFSEINIIVAHTLARDNASVSILRKLGFEKTLEVHDPTDGHIWRWELIRR